ncbi:MAG: radical SAM protein [Deltaproteobacteria bacterium]|nr:radical SAM protein [Deltaproteobacteria bacterium]
MKYEGIIIRPPSEADSILLQVTVGCSHNRCTFCPTYKGVPFRIKSDDEILEDIEDASSCRWSRRLFLCDGDALIIPQKRLRFLLQCIGRRLPWIERVGTYGNAKSILRKSVEELKELKHLGLGIVYLGLESGNEDILKRIEKGATTVQMINAAQRIREAGIKLSVTVLLGIGGSIMSGDHARDTAKVLTLMNPEYIGALTVMIAPHTPLQEAARSGKFVLPGIFKMLEELRIMIDESSFSACLFTSNHASNYLPVRAKLPEERAATLKYLSTVIAAGDGTLLRPEYFRGL